MGLPICDNVGMRGLLTIRVRDTLTRRLLREFTIKNMIVNSGFGTAILLLAQTTDAGLPLALNVPESLRITRLRAGSDGTAPTLTDTQLGDVSFVELAPLVVTHTVIAPFELVASVTLESGMGNGKTFREAGLFTAGITTPDIRMVARQIHPEITKSAAIAIEYEWHIVMGP